MNIRTILQYKTIKHTKPTNMIIFYCTEYSYL